MGALDQAFIKAYTRRGRTPTTTPLDCVRPVPLAAALAERPSQRAANSPAADLPAADLPAADLTDETVRCSVLEAIQGKPIGVAEVDAVVQDPRGIDTKEPSTTETSRDPDPPTTAEHAPMLEQLGLNGAVYRIDREIATEPAEDAEGPFRPMLQVDRFSWPKVCRRLDEAADDELNRLADALTAAMAAGKKVLAIGGCGGNDGATTLVLCAGRRLARRGHRVVMVDADSADPKLAKSLRILAQHGWEEVAAGRLPLGEVVVERACGNLAVLPLIGSVDDESEADDRQAGLSKSLDTLAACYDLVLLDLGSLADPDTDGRLLAPAIARRLDAIAVVHDVRASEGDRPAEVQRCLAVADVDLLGIIENFVTDYSACTNLTGN